MAYFLIFMRLIVTNKIYLVINCYYHSIFLLVYYYGLHTSCFERGIPLFAHLTRCRNKTASRGFQKHFVTNVRNRDNFTNLFWLILSK